MVPLPFCRRTGSVPGCRIWPFPDSLASPPLGYGDSLGHGFSPYTRRLEAPGLPSSPGVAGLSTVGRCGFFSGPDRHSVEPARTVGERSCIGHPAPHAYGSLDAPHLGSLTDRLLNGRFDFAIGELQQLGMEYLLVYRDGPLAETLYQWAEASPLRTPVQCFAPPAETSHSQPNLRFSNHLPSSEPTCSYSWTAGLSQKIGESGQKGNAPTSCSGLKGEKGSFWSSPPFPSVRPSPATAGDLDQQPSLESRDLQFL